MSDLLGGLVSLFVFTLRCAARQYIDGAPKIRGA